MTIMQKYSLVDHKNKGWTFTANNDIEAIDKCKYIKSEYGFDNMMTLYNGDNKIITTFNHSFITITQFIFILVLMSLWCMLYYKGIIETYQEMPNKLLSCLMCIFGIYILYLIYHSFHIFFIRYNDRFNK